MEVTAEAAAPEAETAATCRSDVSETDQTIELCANTSTSAIDVR